MNIISKQLIVLFFSLISMCHMEAQQLPQSSFFTDAKGFWNPGYTGIDNTLSINTRIRQQWVGFGTGAPRFVNIDAQYPIIHLNMAIGGGLNYDQTGPVSKAGLNLNYAYQINELGQNQGRISLGINASGYQYRYDPNDEKIRQKGDPLTDDARQTAFYPNVGVGIMYISSIEKYTGNTVFIIGASAQQAYETNVLTDQLNQNRVMHFNGDIGVRFYSYNSMIEPHIGFNVSNADAIYVIGGINYEMAEAFWAGVGYASSGDMTVQGGVILDEIGGRGTRLKLGLLGNVPISDRLSHFGPTAEFFMRYEFDQR